MKTNMLSTSVKNAKRIYAVVHNTVMAAVLTLLGTGMAFADTHNTSVFNGPAMWIIISCNMLPALILLLGILEKNPLHIIEGIIFLICMGIASLMFFSHEPHSTTIQCNRQASSCTASTTQCNNVCCIAPHKSISHSG